MEVRVNGVEESMCCSSMFTSMRVFTTEDILMLQSVLFCI